MDVQVALISVGVIVVSAAVVYLISFLGTKETSYEEAVAEQRRKGVELIDELARLDGRGSKDRKGHGGNKKWGGRKSKEKGDGEHAGIGELRVGFKVEAEIIPDEDDEDETVVPVLHPGATKHRRHSDEPRSILVTKRAVPAAPIKTVKAVSKPAAVVVATATEAKTKEPSPPKAQLAAATGKGETAKKAEPKTASRESSKEKDEPKKDNKVAVKPATISEKQKVKEATPPLNSAANHAKQAAKAKPEATMSSGQLNKLIKTTSLTNEDIQTLVETLLNKRLSESESSWLKAGQKVDPVSAMRKQLEEREAALTEETQRTLALGNKLKEAKTELIAEKSRANHMERLVKEGQQELQVARKRGDTAVQEAKAFQTKIQELKGEDSVSLRKLQDEIKSLKNAKVQLDTKYATVDRENETLRSSADELSAQLNSLQQVLEQQHHTSEATILQLQEQLQALNLAKTDEESWKQPLEELSSQVQELENEKASILQELRTHSDAEAQLRTDNASLVQRLNQIREDSGVVEQAKRQLEVSIEELRQNLNNSENHTGVLQAQIVDLNSRLVKLQDENVTLREEIEYLSTQVSSFSERQEAEGQEGSDDTSPSSDKTANGHIQVVENDGNSTKIALAEHENILHEKDKLLSQLTSTLREKEIITQELGEQVEQYKSQVTALTVDVEGQKTKNNELREKNWKAMEALKSAENLAKERIEQVEKLQKESQNERLNDLQTKEQNQSKAILERIFPAIRISKSLAYAQWTEEFEREAAVCLAQLSAHSDTTSATNGSEENAEIERKLVESEELCAKLQADIQLYKTVLAQTEAMLNKLQSSVEEEELRWKEKLEAKEKQLEKYNEEKKSLDASLVQIRAAEEAASEMQEKLKELQEKLQVEENERRSLEEHRTELEASMTRLQTQLSQYEEQMQQWKLERESIGEHAKELETLKEELQKEKQTTKTLTTQNVKLNSLVKIGQDSLKAEMQTVGTLEVELNALKEKQAQVATTNGSSPEKSTPVEAQLRTDRNEAGGVTTRSPLSSLSSLLHRSSQPSLDGASSATSPSSSKSTKSKKRNGRKPSRTTLLGCFG